MADSKITQKILYPFQVASLKQKKNGERKTLGVDAQLSAPNAGSETEKAMPLEMHSGFSRFVVTLIKKTESETIFPKANIPANEVAYIFEKNKNRNAGNSIWENSAKRKRRTVAAGIYGNIHNGSIQREIAG